MTKTGNKRTYIGGTKSEARKKYFNYDKELTQIVTNLATSYGISPALVIDRLAHEGLIDRAIINNNLVANGNIVDVFGPSLFAESNNRTYNSSYGLLGLDTIYDTYSKGITKTKRPINIKKITIRNESGEVVNSGDTKNLYDALELFTAELASRRNQVKQRYPNLTDTELDSATAARYNATNKYFKQLMDSGEYKYKYPIDVKGINIPTPTKTDSKYITNQNINVDFDETFRNAPYKDYVYKNKSYNPNLFLEDGYVANPNGVVEQAIMRNIINNNYTHPDKVSTYIDWYKYGGRRKAQLGLSVTDGGTLTPIGKNIYLAQGRTHAQGGIGLTFGKRYNPAGDLEIEKNEIVEIVGGNNVKFNGNKKFKGGGQEASLRVFSSVPLLRGVSPAQLVMAGYDTDAVFKAQEEYKDRNHINDDGSMYKDGGIYIKPSKRGTFTAAAKKRGMGVQEFVSKVLANKEDYSPAMVKKANFARNASRWKKRLGGEDDTKTAALKRLRNKFTIRGNYGGGMFGGAGAGSIIMTQPEYVTDTITKRYSIPVTQNFNDAFGDAANAGLDKFMFNNKWYTTEKGNNPNNNAAGAARTQTVYVPIEHKEVRRRKKEYGGMIYEINGNVKNGLMNLRPKAELGKEKKINSTTKIGADGLIYTWGPDGEWYTDGTRYEDSKYYMREKSVLSGGRRSDGSVVRPKQKTQSLDELVVTAPRINKQEVAKPNDTPTEIVEPIIQTTSNTRPQFYAEKRMPMFGEQSLADKMGLARSGWSYGSAPTISGVNENALAWDYPAINYRKLNRKQREEISKISNTQAVKQEVPTNEKPYTANIPSGYDIASDVWDKYIAPKVADGSINLNAVPEETKTPETKTSENKDERLIGQYKKLTPEDWIGLGSNVIGSLANYFINKNTINKMPMPSRPAAVPAAKLKTRFNINAPLSELKEAEQVQRNIISRNTQSSNVSRAAQQRVINQTQTGRNQLYTQKENIETQLINQDRLNRQSVAARNIASYNDWMNRLTNAKINQSQLRSANVTNLISGLTGGVTDILGRIENRRATNNALRAYAAANPNVDARIIGGFDYYRDAQGRKYDKNGRLIG